MADRPYITIGEVLTLLAAEFPDVTVSKIRFLESKGLLDPERTASGYRRFYPTDVERLRWILGQQRENFLPLKVIKGKLDQLELDDGALSAAATPQPKPKKTAAKVSAKSEPAFEVPNRADDLTADSPNASLSLEDLAKSTGLDIEVVVALESFGLLPTLAPGVSGASGQGDLRFGEDALAISRAAAAFLERGIEPRHLRMYRVFAEREAALFRQVVTSVLAQKNPEARRQALETVGELARLGRGMRTTLLRDALRETLAE